MSRLTALIVSCLLAAPAALVSCASTPSAEGPGTALRSRDVASPGTQVENEAVSYLAKNGGPSFSGARLVNPADFKTAYEREWMQKMGYSAFLADDFENDGSKEVAASVFAGNAYKVVILKKENDAWKNLHSEDTPGPVMIRSEFLGGMGGAKCILAASGQQGNRFGICWDGKGYTRITL